MPNQTYKSIITTVGETLIAQAVASGTSINITKFCAGDANDTYYIPTAGMTALVNQKWEGSVTGVTAATGSNEINVDAAIPYSVSAFTIREIGLKDSDGNLIAIANTAPTPKQGSDSGFNSSVLLRMVIKVSNTSGVTVQVQENTVSITALQEAIQGKMTKPSGGTSGQYLGLDSSGNTAWEDVILPTKASLGLDQVNNTSDANKPISTDTQTALDAKASTTALSNGLATKQPSRISTKATISTSWDGEAPYTQSIYNANVTTACDVEISLSSTATQAQTEAWNALGLQPGGQAAGSFTLRAWGTVNTISIPVEVTIWP